MPEGMNHDGLLLEHGDAADLEQLPASHLVSLFGWLVADGWCWSLLREKYYWLVAVGWLVVREKYCWLVADKPSEERDACIKHGRWIWRGGDVRNPSEPRDPLMSESASNAIGFRENLSRSTEIIQVIRAGAVIPCLCECLN
jgi:hypothetical protein